MLGEIGSVDNIPKYIAKAKDKNDPFRLMGFGHRVYKNYDPRAKIMQKTAHDVLSELGIKDDPLLDVAMELERIALHDDYFIEKKLYPNIDFYSGITLKAMGFPTDMFTVLFAVARTVGWIAQWKEMIDDPGAEDRPPAPALHRRAAPRISADGQSLKRLFVGASAARRGLRVAPARSAIVASTSRAARSLGASPSARRISASSGERGELRLSGGPVAHEAGERRGEMGRRAVPLQEFRDRALAEDEVRQQDRRAAA